MKLPNQNHIRQSLVTAAPIMLGYMAIGIPCGILSASVGMNAVQVFLLCALFYSGAGQFMIPNMWITATPIASILASVGLVNTRQLLYSASLSQYCQKAKKRLAFLFAATVTDESYGINMVKFADAEREQKVLAAEGERGQKLSEAVSERSKAASKTADRQAASTAQNTWSVGRATMVNLFSQSSWTLFCVIGVLLGNALSIPLAIASFAMTSIFICLLSTQKVNLENVIAVFGAVLGVIISKLVGLGGPAILIGALVGVVCAILAMLLKGKAKRAGMSDKRPI